MEHLELVNDMYTRVNRNLEDTERSINGGRSKGNSVNFSSSLNNDFSSRISRSASHIEGNQSASVPRSTDLDFLLYDEMDDVQVKKISKIKNKLKKNKKSVTSYYLYFMLFILFVILNSYYIINLFNSYRLSYYFSLILRGIIFLVLYHYVKDIY